MVSPGRALVGTALSVTVVILLLLYVPVPQSPWAAVVVTSLLPMTAGALASFLLLRREPLTVVVGLSALVAAVPVGLGIMARTEAGVSSMVLGSVVTGVVMAGVHAGLVLGLATVTDSMSADTPRSW